MPRPGSRARILSLAPGPTELVFALGLEDRLVGRTDACDHPPAAAAVPSVGSLFPPDLERVIATRPEVVLMIDGHAPLRAALEARGIPVYVLQPATVDGALASFTRIGQLLHAEAAAAALTARMAAALGPPPPPGGPTVAYAVWLDPLTLAGPKTFLADLIRRAGGRPVPAEAASDWPRYPLERLRQEDPAVLLLPRPLPDGGAFAGLTAVKTGRAVVVPDPDALVRVGPRLAEGAAWLRGVLR